MSNWNYLKGLCTSNNDDRHSLFDKQEFSKYVIQP